MFIKKKEIAALSDNIRNAIDGKNIDFRDNKEGPLSILKNDIHTLAHIKNEQMHFARSERDLLADYLADISHQLKTPITSMRIMADLLDTVPADKQAEFIDNIKISLTHMEWLITTLLKMARLDSGAVNFSTVTVSADQLLKAAIQPLEILLEVKNQSVELLHDSELLCDKRWTGEALTNLLKNASEYSPVNSKIYVDSGSNPISRWISVTDSGKGIPAEKYAGLFKRFAYSQSENGYGIGLPLALSIIKGQNGDIEIDGGGKGTGSTFTIKFFQ